MFIVCSGSSCHNEGGDNIFVLCGCKMSPSSEDAHQVRCGAAHAHGGGVGEWGSGSMLGSVLGMREPTHLVDGEARAVPLIDP